MDCYIYSNIIILYLVQVFELVYPMWIKQDKKKLIESPNTTIKAHPHLHFLRGLSSFTLCS